VWRAESDEGVVAAVKLLDMQRAGAGEHRRFLREYEALVRINHPNVVQVFGTGAERGGPWIAMALIDGPDLEKLLASWANDPPPDRFARVEQIFHGLCEGLRAVHASGVVHRDLKPQNILIGADGLPRITDFGIAREEDTTHVTQIGHLVGTIAYMAPEIIAGEEADVRSDLYALGAILYAMLTGRRPVEADSVAGYLARHLTEPPIPPSRWDPAVPPPLERIALRLLMKEPRQRFVSAADVIRALDGADASGPPLRGRDELVLRWRGAITALRRGRSSVVWLIGPPGSGRTRTLAAVAEDLEADGVGVIDDPGRVVSEAVTPEPVAWLVDDEPAGLLGGLEALRATGRPFLVVVAAKAADDDLLVDEPVETLRLGPLARDAVVALLRDRGAGAPVAAALGGRLHHECGGNPGAVLAWIDALLAHHWLAREGSSLVSKRPLARLREGALPVPVGPADALWSALRKLEIPDQRLVQIVALCGRPAPASILTRAFAALTEEDRGAPPTDDASRRLERLRSAGLLTATDGDGEAEEERRVADAECEADGWVLTAPGGGAIVRAHLDQQLAPRLHRAIATALGAGRRRRGGVAAQAAEHLLAAGDVEAARPLLLLAIRQAARDAQPTQVLRLAGRLLEIPVGGGFLPEERDEVLTLAGEAHFLRGDWEMARDAFRPARDAAGLVGARARGGLGRSLYRLGAWDEAERELRGALALAPDGPTRLGVLRPLADLAMQRNDLGAAERLALETLDVGRAIASRDAEARARRGLAHVRGLQARYAEAREELDRAEDLLDPDGDPHVRIGVCVRAMELDLAAGRWSVGLRRADLARDLLARFALAEREPEATALESALLLEVGEGARAVELARGVLRRVRALGPTGAPTRLRALRVIATFDLAEAAGALAEEASGSAIYDPEGQRLALLARAHGDAGLARSAMSRPPAPYRISAAQIVLDALIALAAVEPAEARSKLASVWPLFTDAELPGLRWHLTRLAVRLGVDDAAQQLIALEAQLRAGLSPAHGAALGR
jgi:tetratricopeptide (TPR) repeat protein